AVVEREPGRAEPLAVRREVRPPTDHSGLEVGQAIPSIAVHAEQRVERREEVQDCGSVASERLLETEGGGLAPELSRADELQRVLLSPVAVRAGGEALHGVDDHRDLSKSRRPVRGDRPRRPPERGGKLDRRQCRVSELPRGAAVLDRVAEAALGVATGGVQRNELARRRTTRQRRALPPGADLLRG